MRLGSSPAELKSRYDVVIIGSGYGGAVAASRLARAGRSVCVLERGKEFQRGEFPDTTFEALQEFQLDMPTRHVGSRSALYDMRLNPELNVFQGCGVGGTSLINSSVCARPDARVFEDARWPQPIRDSLTQLNAEYDRVEKMLGATPYPADRPRPKKLQLLTQCAERLGSTTKMMPLAVTFKPTTNVVGIEQDACQQCGDCVSGCNHGAKNTLAMNYLPDAKGFGAEIFAQIEVRYVSRVGGAWLVYCRWLDAGAARESLFTVAADVVILAAGSLGSSEILLRSRDCGLRLSPRLGHNFSGNGDVLAFAYNCDVNVNGIGWGNRTVADLPDAHVGPCITGAIDLRASSNLEDGIIIQEGAVPGALAPLLPAVLAGQAGILGDDTDDGLVDALQEKARSVLSLARGAHYGAVHNTLTLLVMGHDQSDGQLVLEDDRLRVRWDRARTEQRWQEVRTRLYDISAVLGGTLITDPVTTALNRQHPITVHPLGGCAMGDSAANGVVNHKGQVFCNSDGGDVYEGLYVCDGAIIPRSLGANPLLTIAALAERNVRLLAAERGWHIDDEAQQQLERHDARPGLRFSERMSGFVHRGAIDFDAGWADGKTAGTSLTLQLNVHITDLPAMLQDPEHRAGLVGTVQCAMLSAEPLTISNGEFRLLIIDPEHVNAREMFYTMTLTSTEGERFYLRGRKLVHNDPGFDLWSDTTTLYTVVSRSPHGVDEIARGILRITPLDFLKLLTNVRVSNARSKTEALYAQAAFGKFFAGSLYDTYGGVVAPASVPDPRAEPRKKRSLDLPAPQMHYFTTDDGVRLQLTRYRGGSKGPVMLVAGMGTSSLAFTLDTVDVNLAEYLCAAGYDVWLFDYRASPAVPAVRTQFALDEIALLDYPGAVNEVRRVSGAESVQVIGHCVGSATLLMSMLAGRLPAVRSAICSQFALHVRSTPLVHLKVSLHLGSMLQRLGVDLMTTKYDTNATWLDRCYDVLLRFYPTFRGERCNSPVCRRIRFIYGETFTHSALNHETHRLLYEIFGEANLTILKHLSAVFRKGHVVDSAGKNAYLPNLDRLTTPITFLQGAHNKIFRPEGSRRTWEMLSERNDASHYEWKYLPDYAHMDAFIGKAAYRDVFPYLAGQLDRYNV